MNSQDSKSQGDSEPTQMLEVPHWLQKQRAKASGRQVAGPWRTPPSSSGPGEVGILPSPQGARETARMGREYGRDCEVDSWRVAPFPYQVLPVYTAASAKLSCAAAALVRGAVNGIETELSPAISEVLGREIRMKWAAMGPGPEIRELLKEQAIWMLGRLASGKERMLVGISPGLYRAFLEGIDEGPGDAFSYGVVLFMVTEVMGRLATILGWPPFVWLANPLSREGLLGVVGRSGTAVEVRLQVEVDGRQEWFRIWLPEGVVGEIRQQRERQALDVQSIGVLQGLRLDAMLSVGRFHVSGGGIEEWGVGDVLIFEAHGMRGDEVEKNARPGMARLWLGEREGIKGTMVWEKDRWGFQLEAAAVWSEEGGRAMGQEEKSLNVALNETRLEVEVCVGKLALSVGEVASLKTGQILTTGEVVGGPVSLQVKGAEVAQGELVTVDGHLGVRILRARGEYAGGL